MNEEFAVRTYEMFLLIFWFGSLAFSFIFYLVPKPWKCEDHQIVVADRYCVDKSNLVYFPMATPDNTHVEYARWALYVFIFVSTLIAFNPWIQTWTREAK